MKQLMTTLAFALTVAAAAQDSTSANTVAFSGYLEGYYSYDFNKPGNNARPGFLYSHNRHNEFTVNLAFLKGSYQSGRARANLAVAVGSYMNANYAAEPGVLKNIFEASAGYKLCGDHDLWLDIGILPSHIGFESALSKDCWMLTRSLAAENSPYYESGAKLSWNTKNSKWFLSVLALNGWQRIQRVEGNSLMNWGTQLQWKPNDKVLVNYSTFLGSDHPDSVRKWRYFHDVYATIQFTGKAGLILGFDLGRQQVSKNSREKNTWFTPVGIFRFTPSQQWAFAVRGEYYSDEEEVIIATGSPNGFKTIGFSANIDYRPVTNMALRLEGRVLDSKDNIFIKEGSPGDNNTAVSFSAAVSF